MDINNILNQIDLGAMALPEFQRGYVWNRNQVRELMNSLYQRYPVGGLLVWVTKTESAEARGFQQLSAGNVRLILDGQQRITSLYGIIRGAPPPFFEGNANAFSGLYFHLEDETFEFYGPVKMQNDPYWISVTELMQKGLGPFFKLLNQQESMKEEVTTYLERLNRIVNIKDIKFHIEEVSGSDKTVDVVVDIFNRVNSGGTKLSKGDLALARICAEWPDARQELRAALAKWEKAGFDFKMDWLLRNVNTITTGEALFSALKDVSTTDFQHGLQQAVKGIDYVLNIIGGRLGLDHDRVLGGRYALPIMTRYTAQNGGKLKNAVERDKLLYWYVHTFLWGRFAASTESVLNQDLALMEEHEGALDRLIEQLQIWRGDLTVRPENFAGWSRGARFYPMLYLLTRVGNARDWGTGLPLKADLLGKNSGLQLHHIFPKAQLYKAGYDRTQVNALANFCFLTQATNLAISDSRPEVYFAEIESTYPGALASQWVPMDETLWEIEHYPEFLTERQKLLADAANTFLASLLHSEFKDEEPALVAFLSVSSLGGIADAEEEELLLETNIWVQQQGLPEGEMLFELADDATGDVIAILDLAWPQGLQTGLSEPVALLLNEDRSTLEQASAANFRCFTGVAAFRGYVLSEIMALDPVQRSKMP